MTYRDYGYYGCAYLGARVLQLVALISVIGLVGKFIDEIAKTKHSAPGELTGTLVVAVICALWTLLSLSAYDDTYIPYFATALVDLAIFIPLVVVAAVLGGPLSQTTCADLPASASAVLLPLPAASPVSYLVFVGAGQTTCYELAAVWGLAIALCVLFTVSAVAAAFLWLGKRRALPPGPPSKRAAPSSAAPSITAADDFELLPQPPPPPHFD
ncbi:hypothetical protein P8C59_003782 [Phyllachora maydis]|uniref:MARVEL domain-containing protein n=1 Tax=Phyllachora maydis TaxID=1825666 RepID=A0AAD9I1E4_9PEZI|nr:hypothetical protein P8C59_003782 [Phyllachora maydis]